MTFSSTPTRSREFENFAAALAGQYEIDHEIGRGGMGVVYAARDVKLDRPVAIKTLPPHLAADPTIRERFLREARTAGALSHPNIVPVHRADEIDGHVFFVMAIIDGMSLAQHLRDARVSQRATVRVLRDVADALGYAHRRGIVHRDVKAENILIEADTGRPMITDFGIARLAESAPLTATGQLLGTVYYLSPEQIAGDAVDGRSDIYSLGVVGFYALSGRFPFDAPLASAVIVAHATKPAPMLLSAAPHVPPRLAAIIDRCLLKDPASRFATGEEFAAALTSLLDEPGALDGAVTHMVAAPAPIVSDTEARAIWDRAARLQADTGVVPRSAPVPAPRDARRVLSRTAGHDLGTVRAAAQEAGIPERYVEHALAEHGLAPVAPAPKPGAIENRSADVKWLGAPTMLDFEIVIDGEVSSDDFDVVGALIQRTVGENGTLSSVGRALTWHSADEKKVQVTVFARGGTTTIRATESIREIAAGIGVAGMMIGGVLVGGVSFGAMMAHHIYPLSAVGVWLGIVGAAFVTVTSIIGTVSERRQQRVRDMVERLAAEVRATLRRDEPDRK